MLKIEVDDKTTKVEIRGTLTDICAGLSNAIYSVHNSLKEQNEKTCKEFEQMFTKGFMDGICFGTNRNEMDKILADADNIIGKGKTMDALKELLDKLCEILGDNCDEAE